MERTETSSFGGDPHRVRHLVSCWAHQRLVEYFRKEGSLRYEAVAGQPSEPWQGCPGQPMQFPGYLNPIPARSQPDRSPIPARPQPDPSPQILILAWFHFCYTTFFCQANFKLSSKFVICQAIFYCIFLLFLPDNVTKLIHSCFCQATLSSK